MALIQDASRAVAGHAELIRINYERPLDAHAELGARAYLSFLTPGQQYSHCTEHRPDPRANCRSFTALGYGAYNRPGPGSGSYEDDGASGSAVVLNPVISSQVFKGCAGVPIERSKRAIYRYGPSAGQNKPVERYSNRACPAHTIRPLSFPDVAFDSGVGRNNQPSALIAGRYRIGGPVYLYISAHGSGEGITGLGCPGTQLSVHLQRYNSPDGNCRRRPRQRPGP